MLDAKTAIESLNYEDFYFSTRQVDPGQHYTFQMSRGQLFPNSKQQAKYFISNCQLGMLNCKDVERVEMLLNKHGIKGVYKHTGSKLWVKLQNISDLHNALKLEYGI